ncbi:hypothetical protein AF71_00058730 [Rhizobium sp. 57MFTsu3.2]|nr:hypothetical protein [Rhizobium sp. 57MFTsu3.2]
MGVCVGNSLPLFAAVGGDNVSASDAKERALALFPISTRGFFPCLRLVSGLSPASGTRFLLGTEPALAILRRYLRGLVVVLARYVIDAFAGIDADVALDVAVRASLDDHSVVNDHWPCLCGKRMLDRSGYGFRQHGVATGSQECCCRTQCYQCWKLHVSPVKPLRVVTRRALSAVYRIAKMRGIGGVGRFWGIKRHSELVLGNQG